MIKKPEDLLKQLTVLEFLGLEEKSEYVESDLEAAIIDKLQPSRGGQCEPEPDVVKNGRDILNHGICLFFEIGCILARICVYYKYESEVHEK